MSGIQRRIFKVVSVVLLFALACGIAYMPMNINAQAQQQIVFKKNKNSYDSYMNKYKNAILDCIPDAKLIYGLKREVSAEELKSYIEEDRITEICNFVPVHKGDAFFIPSGTIHAIGEGILIAEVQQNSNITYRVSDYGRLGTDGKPRALHKQKAFEVISREPTPVAEKINAVINSSGMKERQLASCKYFNVKSILLDGEYELFDDNSFVSVLVLEGECELKYNGNALKLKKGSSVFVPAGIKVHISGKAELLISCV